MSEDPVKLYLQKDHVFVWNADDVERIRREYRISGVQVGCLPRCPYQSVFLGLPVQLSMDEAHLLVTKGKAVLVKNTRLTKAPTDQDRARLEKHAQEIHEQQVQPGVKSSNSTKPSTLSTLTEQTLNSGEEPSGEE